MLYLAVTLLFPVVLWLGVEVGLRSLRPSGGLPLFVDAPGTDGRYLAANPLVARRYFATEQRPPRAAAELFAAVKPANGFRVFVLGESAAAGFPYPANGSFSRLLGDVLRDVLPADSVEVVNLAIAATNSYTLQDLAGEVAAASPDLVLVYAGHNEYYGALGVGSSEGAGTRRPAVVRAYLRLLRLRTFLALRDGLASLRSTAGQAPASDSVASLMEVLAGDQQIALDSDSYRAGLRQFEGNMTLLVERLEAAGVPVFVGSVASNERSMPPLASPGNDGADGARTVYAQATRALAAGDSAAARAGFARARDLDVVRFRAPSALDSVLGWVAERSGATYVPVAEAFSAASPAGSPGAELFLEHVHPNSRGYSLMARAFYDAIAAAGFLGREASPGALRPWAEYEAGRELTAFDERIAHHAQQTLLARWPFVPSSAQRDYRGSYRPTGVADSLALLVSRGGMSWGEGKLRLGEYLERQDDPEGAAAEYRGVIREAPLSELPRRLLGRALAAAGKPAEAETALRAALATSPSSDAAFQLGMLALGRQEVAPAIELLELAVRLDPTHAPALYQLSLAYGLARDLPRARAIAQRLARLQPDYPGLAGWIEVIGDGR